MNYINKRAQTQKRGRSAPINRSQKGPKKQTSPRLTQARGYQLPPVAQLSECVLKYATAISDPWSPHADGACVPIQPSRPSQKVKAFIRATGVVGTSGVGGFTVSPCLGNDSTCLMFTNAGFTGATLQNITSATVGVSTASHNGPWTRADVASNSTVTTAQVQGRIVSAGASIQYTGTVLNQSGLYYMLVDPNHQNLNPSNTATILGSFSETLVKRVTSGKEFMVTSSLDISENEYYNPATLVAAAEVMYNYPYSSAQSLNSTDTSTGGAPMACIFTGVAGSTFEIEVVLHIEFVGKKTQALLTPSHADSKGYEIVAAAAAKLPAMRVAMPNLGLSNLMTRAINGITTGLQPAFGAIGQGIGTALGGAVGAYVGAPMIGGAIGGGVGRGLGSRSGQLMITNG